MLFQFSFGFIKSGNVFFAISLSKTIIRIFERIIMQNNQDFVERSAQPLMTLLDAFISYPLPYLS